MNIEIGNFNIKAISPGYMSCAMPDKIRLRWHPVHILIRIHTYISACAYVWAVEQEGLDVLSRFESHWRVNYASHDVFHASIWWCGKVKPQNLVPHWSSSVNPPLVPDSVALDMQMTMQFRLCFLFLELIKQPTTRTSKLLSSQGIYSPFLAIPNFSI